MLIVLDPPVAWAFNLLLQTFSVYSLCSSSTSLTAASFLFIDSLILTTASMLLFLRVLPSARSISQSL